MNLLLRLIFIICIAFSVLNVNAQEWQDYSMPDDTTVFHKMCSYEDQYWAIDYGNGRIYKSKNSGKDWQLNLQTQGEYLEAIQFLDKKTGFVCGDYGIILKTMDGGKSWNEIGPTYTPRVTKANPMEKDSAAIDRNYYELYFNDKDNGLVWGFEVQPLLGFRESYKPFFYMTNDGGSSWKRIDYNREELDAVKNAFLKESLPQEVSAMGIYQYKEKSYNVGRHEVDISNNGRKSWQSYTLPQKPDKRFMIRTINFVSENQGYIFCGNLEEESTGYIFETLDGGKTWRSLETDLPHIHYSIQKDKEILLSGKDKLLRNWTPVNKADSSFVHKGNASKILIDGNMNKGEWDGANRTFIKEGVDLYTLQDEHFLYLSVKYDTSLFKNYYCDLYFELGADSLINIHASQQLGERVLTGRDWTDAEPAFKWGYTSDWTANYIKFDRGNKVFVPYEALEFQISKKKLPKDKIKIALQSRDMNWEEQIVNFPKDGIFKSTKNWVLLYF